ncbi:MAG: aldo/keto reductase [Oscillospiraceae bacterium]|nr:aldo/keto reductase [Oscillospiraceae bacterium]
MSFELIHKNFGFGFMRLPMIGEDVDIAQTCQMVDCFLENGFNYFDTAHGYINGKSELAIRECLTSRYPRDRYILTNKLSPNFFEKQEDIRPLLEHQLESCGVEYFDFYLMHAQSLSRLPHYRQARAYETALELKEEGKIRHMGISFHDTAEALDQILTEYPQIEVVQIQFNYVDYEDSKVQSRQCYEVCRKHGKPVIVMEPVKGGSLVNLPPAAQKVFDRVSSGSNANYAIRFAAGFEGMIMVLSGMSNMEQMQDNVSFMKDYHPLNSDELDAVKTVCAIFRNQGLIPCTGCRYCTEVCPQGIAIPEIFTNLNALRQQLSTQPITGGMPEDCLNCGKCEESCPQNLNIRELLRVAAEEL